jgi:hypothetical protein
MKYSVLLFSFSLLLLACNDKKKPADTSNYSTSVKVQAEAMGQLMLKRDFESFTKFTYPKIVEIMGGKQNMIAIMEKGSKEMELQGIGFLNVTFGMPSKVITVKDEFQCTLLQTIEMKVAGGKLVTKSTLIAISKDNGANWYFVDSAGKDIITMKKTLPNLSAELILLQKQEPVFHKE